MKKLHYLGILSFISISVTFGQIELVIDDGMTVETTGGVYISNALDVVENGTGYLKGTVESSSLSAAAQFAGLTFGTGFTGTITRTTGTDYNGVTAPKTTLRSYKLVSSSAITPNVGMALVTSGTNNETNGLAEKYIYTENGGMWKGYSDNGSTANNIKAAGVAIPSGTSYITITEGVGLAAKIFLEGPYNTVDHNMFYAINASIPFLSPYALGVRTASAIPTNVVDWVLVEIRTTTASSSVVGYRSAFVDDNGNIINDAGATTGIGLPGIDGTEYYAVVRHRNHLGIMSSSARTLNWLSP